MARPFFLRLAGLLFAVAAHAATPNNADPQGWVNLFDGATLEGWVQRGEFTEPFRVEEGQIVGPSARNAFLCTREEYADFVLELEFKLPVGINSGIQVRSHCLDHPGKLEWAGKQIEIPAGRVHGYQIEIDPSPRAWTGGLYEEGRRGWLQNLEKNETARRAFKQGVWNRLRIECRGSSIKSWLNGVPAADASDTLDRTGFIALQVAHGGKGHDPLEVRFRNIRLQRISP